MWSFHQDDLREKAEDVKERSEKLDRKKWKKKYIYFKDNNGHIKGKKEKWMPTLRKILLWLSFKDTDINLRITRESLLLM